MGGVYRLEYAKGSTSMCKGPKPCAGTKIGKGMLRWGTVIQFQGKDSFAWRHFGCVTPRIIEGSKADETKPEDLDGFEELTEEDQARVVKAYEEGKVADEDIPESAKIHHDEEGNVIPYVAPVVVKEKKKAAPRKKAAKKDSDDEGDDEDKPKKKPAKKVTVKAVAEGKKAAPKKQTKAKKAKSESEGDNESEAEAMSTDEDKPKKKSKAAGGKRSRKDEDEDVPPPRAPSSRARGPVKSFKELLTSDEEDDDKSKKSSKKSKKAESDENEDSD